jgi:hypothetical protein
MSLLTEALVGARFLARLPRFLRQPWHPAEARRVVEARLRQRETTFLALVRSAVYANPASPYRALLAAAGCEHGDLVALVRRDGIEGALARLLREGLYLTVDEFKGRRPLTRRGVSTLVTAEGLQNPHTAVHVINQSGQTRGVGTPVQVDLRYVRDVSANVVLCLDGQGGLGWAPGAWEVPGGAAILTLLRMSACGARGIRWFVKVPLDAPGLHPRYRWSARALRWGSLVVGRRLPPPLHVPVDRPDVVVRWLAETLAAGRTPYLFTFASSAVVLCRTAARLGVDLAGVQFAVTGEPLTPARLAVILAAGADAANQYGSAETGYVGHGCLARDSSDDTHVCQDLHAVIQPGAASPGPELPPSALLVTSMRPTAPLVLLNVSMGDEARLRERRCGCPLDRPGWTQHLEEIRSFEKLTAAGMTFLDADVIRILEDVLPARFGGGPTDYQLVEAEGPGGEPRLTLLVHPDVGPVDVGAMAGAFLDAIGGGSGVERVMAAHWRRAGLPTVERQPPRTTALGKIQHLHVEVASAREGTIVTPTPREHSTR